MLRVWGKGGGGRGGVSLIDIMGEGVGKGREALTVLTEPFQTAGSLVQIVSIILAATLICPTWRGKEGAFDRSPSWLFEVEAGGGPVRAVAAIRWRAGKSTGFWWRAARCPANGAELCLRDMAMSFARDSICFLLI